MRYEDCRCVYARLWGAGVRRPEELEAWNRSEILRFLDAELMGFMVDHNSSVRELPDTAVRKLASMTFFVGHASPMITPYAAPNDPLFWPVPCAVFLHACSVGYRGGRVGHKSHQHMSRRPPRHALM